MDDRQRAKAGKLSLVTPSVVRRRYASDWLEAQVPERSKEAPPTKSRSGTSVHLLLAGNGHLHCTGRPPVALGPGDVVITRGALDAERDPVARCFAVSPDDADVNEHRAVDHAFRHRSERVIETVAALYDANTLVRFGVTADHWLHVPAQRLMGRQNLATIANLIRSEIERGETSQVLLQRLFDVLFLSVLRDSNSAATRGAAPDLVDLRIQRVVHALRDQLAEPWNVAKMAKLAGMSRAAFVRKFKKTTGAAPLAYLTRLRIDHARERLTESDDQVAEIADHVGYDSVYAFSRAFKRVVGIAPRVFRRRARNAFTPITSIITMTRRAA